MTDMRQQARDQAQEEAPSVERLWDRRPVRWSAAAGVLLAGRSVVRGRQVAAAAALATALAAVLVAAVYVVYSPFAAAGSVLALIVAMVCGWYAVARRHHRVAWAASGLVALAVSLGLLLDSRRDAGLVAAIVILALVSVGSARVALRREVALRRAARGVRVPPSEHPVLMVNPGSGEGKAYRAGVIETAERKQLAVVVLRAGEDLARLAEQAIANGADALGTAGGDGSQAVVAHVAARAQVPLVCVPSGTRNHFGVDLGIDVHNPAAALDAFDEALEYRVDLGLIVDGAGVERAFVNNVVMGIYGRAVQAPRYRVAKRDTVLDVFVEFAGTAAFDLRLGGPDGSFVPAPDLLFVGNNPYRLSIAAGFGTRPRLDTGELGIVSVRIDHPSQLPRLAALGVSRRARRFRDWTEWSAPELTVDADEPVEAGVDGEAVVLVPPIRFRTLPEAVRVRLPLAPRSGPGGRLRRIPLPLTALGRLARHGGLAARPGEPVQPHTPQPTGRDA